MVASGGDASGVGLSGAGREDALGAFDRALERLLALVGGEPEDPGDGIERSYAVACRLFVLAVAAESWNALRYTAYQPSIELHTALAVWVSACALWVWLGRSPRVGITGVLVGLVAAIALVFPENANHHFAEVLALSFLLLAGDARTSSPQRRREQQRSLRALRWILVIGFFWAGAQKLAWGYYLQGEFLAERIAIDPNFAQVFQWLVPAGELERLRGLEMAPGAGPYRVASPLFVAVSNAVWLGEIALALLLFWEPARRLAIVGCVALLAAIQLGARELYFGLFMLNLCLLFWGGAVYARSLPFFAAAYLYLAAMALGWLPHWDFG